MNAQQAIATAPDQASDGGEISIVDLLIILAKHKKRIVGWSLLAVVGALVLGFALPNIYRAGTKLLPPQQAQSGAGALLAQIGGITGGVAKNPNDLYVGMLKSRTIADQLIKKYNLTKVYETDSIEKARKILESNTYISAGKDGLITVEVESKDKKLVARLANAYVDELLALTKVLAVTEAGQRRMFFERQLEISKNNLAAAEMALKEALELHGVISVDSDSRAIVETLARLRAQISAKEIQLSAMRAFVTTNNQDFKHGQEVLNSLRSEFSKLQNGRPGAEGPVAGGKSQGLENIKILREVKYHQQLYELLSKQYEAARLDEARDSSVIQVLDAAIEPERKFKPARLIIVLLLTAMALFAAIVSAFISEAKQNALRIPERKAQWDRLGSYLRW